MLKHYVNRENVVIILMFWDKLRVKTHVSELPKIIEQRIMKRKRNETIIALKIKPVSSTFVFNIASQYNENLLNYLECAY